MGEIAWLEGATNRDIDPHRRIMRPTEIRYELLEPQARGLVRALNDTGVVETLWSCAGHPLEDDRRLSSAYTDAVLLHVLDEACWRDAALAIAHAVRSLAGVTMAVSFDHEAQLRFAVPMWLEPVGRRTLLDATLDAAERALRDWSIAAAPAAAEA
jgi:hypothetical protein